MHKVLVAAVLSGFIACSANGTGSTGSTDGGGVQPSGDATVATGGSVGLGLSSQRVAGIPIGASDGSYEYTAQVVLTNVSSATPVALVSAAFSATTDSARVLMPTTVVGCPSGDRLALGGRAMCELHFTVTLPQRPVTVAYDDGAGHAATVAAQAVDLTPSPIDYCIAAVRYSGSGQACTDCLETNCRSELSAETNAMIALGAMRDAYGRCSNNCRGSASLAAQCDCERACSEPYWLALNGVYACMINRCASACR